MEDETMSLDKADSLDSVSRASVEEEEVAKKV